MSTDYSVPIVRIGTARIGTARIGTARIGTASATWSRAIPFAPRHSSHPSFSRREVRVGVPRYFSPCP